MKLKDKIRYSNLKFGLASAILVLACLVVLTKASITDIQTSEANSILDQIEQEMDSYFAGPEVETQIVEFFRNRHHTLDRKILARALYLYGRLVFVGLGSQGDQGTLRLAYYYFRLSAFYGNGQAQFMVALFAYFQMDGSLNLLAQLQTNPSLEIPQDMKARIFAYLTDRKFSLPDLNLLASSYSDNLFALASLGYKHLKGIGSQLNCSSSFLFYERAARDILANLNFYSFDNLRQYRTLDLEIFGKNVTYMHRVFKQSEITKLENSPIQYEEINDLHQLALYYTYGVNGVPKNHQRALQLYIKLLGSLQNKKDITSIQSTIALIRLFGEDIPRDYELSKKEFQALVRSNDSNGYLGLGLMSYLGLGVEQNLTEALNNFQQSAKMENPAGLFYYGSLLMQPETAEKFRDNKEGLKYITAASNVHHHALAQYVLATLYLDGVDTFYSCELGVKLLQSVAKLGPWSELLARGNYLTDRKSYKRAFSYYIQAAMTGDIQGFLNSGILADSYKIFSKNDYDYLNLPSQLEVDEVHKILKAEKRLPYFNIWNFLYDDVLQLLRPLGLNESYTQFQQILSFPEDQNLTLNNYLGYKCFSLSVYDFSYSSLRLGDYYYYGIYNELSAQKAFNYYQISAQIEQNQVFSQIASLNLAEMLLKGEGVEQNFNKSLRYYQASLNMTSNLFDLIATKIYYRTQWAYYKFLNVTTSEDFSWREQITIYSLKLFSNQEFMVFSIVTGLLFIIFLFIFFRRKQNLSREQTTENT